MKEIIKCGKISSDRKIFYNYMNIVIFKTNQFKYIMNIFKENYVSNNFIYFTLHTSVDFLKGVWRWSDSFFYRKILPFMMYCFKPRILRTIYVNRLSLVKIDQTNGNLNVIGDRIDQNFLAKQSDQFHGKHNYEKSGQFARLRARFLQHGTFGQSVNNTLIMHVHGGGFVSQSPDSSEVRSINFD
jgi:hypothetical protein